MKQKLLVEFSGGESSGYMTKTLLDFYSDRYEIIVCFANTGEENEETLEFVNMCDREFGFNTVWVEAVFGDRGESTTHRVVNYSTAVRGASLFEAMSAKYGIPNVNYKHCTRELKLHPIHHYVKTMGWAKGNYKTAIGIRADEPRRQLNETNPTQELFDDIALPIKKKCWQKVIHPMVSMFPVSKSEVSEWWEAQNFRLQLEEHQGNCKWCYKKSLNKHRKLYSEDKSNFDTPKMLEDKYGHIGGNRVKGVLVDQPRKIFRGFTSTTDLIHIIKVEDSDYIPKVNHSRCANEECSTLSDEQYQLFAS